MNLGLNQSTRLLLLLYIPRHSSIDILKLLARRGRRRGKNQIDEHLCLTPFPKDTWSALLPFTAQNMISGSEIKIPGRKIEVPGK
jgi:hypothetical protein